ncbi:MAG TPA: YfiR family protein [Edaphobacter sp.]|uniref:YfiR family protein n=1 Tax=Edaphobacter sp. TaxID=1934404 RepID=UPI002BE981BB|nr:YfiR family protein [Edaphobacter sp.]HUZ96981.1 YfiR family protein [Edaphobacter sp.]
MLLFQAPQSAYAQTATDVYKVKAAFLFHFAQLVDWPSDAFNSGDQSLNLCIFDDEPHLQELQSALEGKPIGTRVVHVRRLRQTQPLQGCSILFLGRNEGRRQSATLRSLHGQPVLTVGESNNFLSEGGIIRLHLVQDKVRFDINVGVADSSRLKISSRLLLLASSVTLGDQAKGGQ